MAHLQLRALLWEATQEEDERCKITNDGELELVVEQLTAETFSKLRAILESSPGWLRSLSLVGKRFANADSPGADELALGELLLSCTALTSVKVSHHRKSLLDFVAFMLEQSQTLTNLDLAFLPFKPDQFPKLAASLHRSRSLTRIRIMYIDVFGETLRTLLSAANANLQSIHLIGVSTEPGDVPIIAAFLRNTSTLQEFDLSLEVCIRGNEYRFDELADALLANTSLQSFGFSGFRADEDDDQDEKALQEAGQCLDNSVRQLVARNLKSLTLDKTTAIHPLPSLLQKGVTLEELSLFAVPLDLDVLVRVLQHDTPLKKLNISLCSVKPDVPSEYEICNNDTKALPNVARAIATNPRLESVNLEMLQFPLVLPDLISGLRTNTTLTSLNLSSFILPGEETADDIGVALFSALSENNTLQELILQRACLGNRTAEQLVEYLRNPFSLRRINLSRNKFTAVNFVALFEGPSYFKTHYREVRVDLTGNVGLAVPKRKSPEALLEYFDSLVDAQ